jgi:hypothetical protein
MFNLNLHKIFFASLVLMLYISACNNPPKQPGNKQNDTYSAKIARQIAAGKRVENINNDSLKIVALDLYQLNKLSGNDTAMVYAELFEATYYWQAADHRKAMRLAIQSLADAQRFKISKLQSQIYALIGNLHKETTNYNMAFKAAQSGLDVAINNKDTAQIISLLGLKAMFTRGLSLNRHQPRLNDSSIELNLAALKMAESNPKYEKIRIRFYNNIGQYYKDKRELDKTFYYINKAIELCNKHNQQRSLTYSYCWLGQAYYFKGEQAKGLDYLHKAMQIANNLKQPYRVMEINAAIYDCYIASNNYKGAMHFYNVYRNMRDSLKVLDNVKQISELQVKYETVQKDKEITSLNAKAKFETLQRNAILIVLLLLIIIAVLIYIKQKKDKKLLLADKELVDKELQTATLELHHFTDSLQHKNELIEEFKAQIEQLHLQHINKADIEGLDKLVKAHIMTDENWDNFKKLFIKVHGNFFTTLKKKYPNLTATDNRMLSLIKLQLGNHEMANMLGVTVEGVKKSKQRLRKKMNLHLEENLNDIITAL